MPKRPAGDRIISLLPAATETVFALGAGDQLVGVSHECDHPPAANERPRVTRPRVDASLPSRELDAAVKDATRDGGSLYDIDAKLLRRLAPDLILTQVQCDVCAVTPKDLKPALEALDRAPKVVALDGQSLEGVLADIHLVGGALDRTEDAKLLLFRQWRLIKEIRHRVEGLERQRLAVLDWLDPLMFAGNWMPGLAQIAGGDYALVPAGKPSRWGSLEELEEYAPQVIVAAPCGRDVATTAAELGKVFDAVPPEEVPALDDRRVFVGDGHQFFNRPGPRLVYTAALLARALHPTLPPLPPALEPYLVPWTPR